MSGIFPPNKKKVIVAVEWDDAHGNAHDQVLEDISHKPLTYTSVGILLLSDEVGVSLCMDLCEDGNVRTTCFVPRKMIQKEWIVGPLHKSKKRPNAIQSNNVEPSPQVE